jgi:ribonuclease D
MLLVKVFTLRFSDGIEEFEDDSLRAFMADNEVVSLKERFFFKDNVPYWSVMVVYRSRWGLTSKIKKDHDKESSKKDDYRSVLTKKSMPLFNLLREWRNKRARKEGYPAYIMFTNLQLAEIATLFPETLSQLLTVEGVGKSKLEKYGQDILTIVKTFKEQQEPAEQTESPAEPSPKETAQDIKAPLKSQEQGNLWEKQKGRKNHET